MKKRILKYKGAKIAGMKFAAGWKMTASVATSSKRKRPVRMKNPVHPGEILLEEFLLPMKRTQIAFAAELGWPRAKLSGIIKGRRAIEAESALDLAGALGTTPELWMNLQVMWDLHRAQKRRKAS